MCVGEYVTLYQQQRSAMRLRANEREGYIYQLARERIDLQVKLGELQSLVVTLLGERNMLHSYQTQTRPPATTNTTATTSASVTLPNSLQTPLTLQSTPSKRRQHVHGTLLMSFTSQATGYAT